MGKIGFYLLTFGLTQLKEKKLQSDYICFNLSMNDKIIVRSIVDADVCGNGGGYFINLKKKKLVLI